MTGLVRTVAVVAVIYVMTLSGVRGAPAQPTELVVGDTVDLTTLDPLKNTVVSTETTLINIYDTLVLRDATMRLRPGLATTWRNIDPTTWEFTLRQNVKFHNGEPFDAQTVKFSLDRGLDPKTAWSRAGAMRLIKSVTVVDSHRVRIATERPWALLPAALARHGWMVPRQHVQNGGEEVLLRQPVGTGPFKYVRWVRDDRLEMVANNDYWRGRPKFNRAVVRFIPNDSSRLAELLAGSIHLNRRIAPEHYQPVERGNDTALLEGPSLGVNAINFLLLDRPANHPLRDARVRQAINLAINRRAMLESIMRGKGQPLATFCTQAMFGCDQSVGPFAFDVERARALMREAGYASGFDMIIVTTEGRYVGDRDLTLAVADQLRQINVRARVIIMESGVWLRQLLARKFETGDATFFPSTGLLAHAGVDVAGQTLHSKGFLTTWNNSQFDELLDLAETSGGTSVGNVRARALLRDAQLLFKEEAPTIPMFVLPNIVGVRSRLQWIPPADQMMTLFDVSWKSQ